MDASVVAAAAAMASRRVTSVMSSSLLYLVGLDGSANSRRDVSDPSTQRKGRSPIERAAFRHVSNVVASEHRVPRHRNLAIAVAALFDIGERRERIVEALHQHLLG